MVEKISAFNALRSFLIFLHDLLSFCALKVLRHLVDLHLYFTWVPMVLFEKHSFCQIISHEGNFI